MKIVRLSIIALAAACAALPAHAQRIELEGGNSGTITIGPTGTEIERDMRGHLHVGIGEDGLDLDAGVGIEAGMARDSVREDTAGQTPPPQFDAERHERDDIEPCPDAARIEAERAAFLAADPPQMPDYIRQIDLSGCTYPPSEPLVLRLNAMPEVRIGLDHMDVRPEEVVSARWTPTFGLVVYTTRE